jgi:hypothetical protein
LKLLLTSKWEWTSLQDSSFSIVTKFDIDAIVINLVLQIELLPLFKRNTLFKVKYWVSWSERPLIIGKTLNRMILELSIKILYIVEHEVLLNLVGKSTTWNKLYDWRRHDKSLEKSTWKSPHMINSILVLYKNLRVESNWFKNWRNYQLVIYKYILQWCNSFPGQVE